VDSKSELSA